MADMHLPALIQDHHPFERWRDQVDLQVPQSFRALQGKARHFGCVSVHPPYASLAELAWTIKKQNGSRHLTKVVLALQ